MKKAPAKRPTVSPKRVTARPNRIAGRFSRETIAVVLDPDVAHVFRSSDSVNAFLRSAIAAMPRDDARKKKRPA